MDDDLDKFIKIENKRKLIVEEGIKNLIEERRIQNEILQKELQNIACKSMMTEANAQSEHVVDTKYFNGQQVELNKQFIDNRHLTDRPTVSSKKEEIQPNKLPKLKFNVPMSDFFIKKYIITDIYKHTETMLAKEKEDMTSATLLRIKLAVNKRIGQVTVDAGHIYLITESLKKYNGYVFYELVIIKILEQAKLQVSSCFKSYKSYGMLLNNLYTPQLHSLFLVGLMCDNGHGALLKSMYSVYFDVLRHKNLWKEAYNFFAGLLNEQPTSDAFYVIEAFLLVLGEDMCRIFGSIFSNITKYIMTEYFSRGSNEPCKVRIRKIIEDLWK